MKQLSAFLHKEWLELLRSGKLFMSVIIFMLFGIMNPAMAKLTPWIMKMASESLEETGLVIKEITVDAYTSWTQFYKNIALIVIVFLLIISAVLTVEYQKKTLVNMVTKGLSRWKILAAKTFIVLLLWTVCYFLCYGITYAYTVYFWDMSVVSHVFFSAFCVYVIGVWLITLVMLMSVLVESNVTALLLTGGIYALVYALGFVAKIKEYMPTALMGAGALLTSDEGLDSYVIAVLLSLGLAVLQMIVAVVVFNKRDIC